MCEFDHRQIEQDLREGEREREKVVEFNLIESRYLLYGVLLFWNMVMDVAERQRRGGGSGRENDCQGKEGMKDNKKIKTSVLHALY